MITTNAIMREISKRFWAKRGEIKLNDMTFFPEQRERLTPLPLPVVLGNLDRLASSDPELARSKSFDLYYDYLIPARLAEKEAC